MEETSQHGTFTLDESQTDFDLCAFQFGVEERIASCGRSSLVFVFDEGNAPFGRYSADFLEAWVLLEELLEHLAGG